MNYYEELGIDPSANDEEIGRAHRRLARLMHPDQQVDAAVKKLAETQMRRLNAIVDVLTDPGKRHLYDEQLQGKGAAPPTSGSTQALAKKKKTSLPALEPTPSLVLGLRRIWRALPWWVWSTAGALAMTLAISWMVADYTGSSFENRPTDYVRPKDEPADKDHKQTEPDRSPAPAPRQHDGLAALNRILAAMQAVESKPPPTVPDKKPEVKTDDVKTERITENAQKPAAPIESSAPTPPIVTTPKTERAASPETNAPEAHTPEPVEVAKTAPIPSTPKALEAKPLKASDAKPSVIASTAKATELKPTPEPTASAASPDPKAKGKVVVTNPPVASIAKPDPQNPLAGDWVYAPVEPEKPAKGYFPPEFIELRLVSEQGLLRGEYRARYQVTDAPVRPDIDFQVIANGANSKKFSWQSSDGSKGVLKITQVDAQNIEVEWKRTTKSQAPELNVGTATLTRRNIE